MPEYVNWLRHASPYINAHRDCTFVVMLPGDGVEHPNFGNIVHDLVLLHSLGVRLVLVHGSRPQIESRLAARGLAAMIDGLWLRGSLVGGQFNAEKSRRIAYGYIDFQLQAVAL